MYDVGMYFQSIGIVAKINVHIKTIFWLVVGMKDPKAIGYFLVDMVVKQKTIS